MNAIKEDTKLTVLSWGLLIRDYLILLAFWLLIKVAENGFK